MSPTRFVIAGLIITFWGVMTGLLLKREFGTAGELLRLPPEHLLELMFRHEQSSSLIISNNDTQVGTLNFFPTRHAPNPEVPELNTHQLRAMTNVGITLPGGDKRRLVANLRFHLNDKMQMEELSWIVVLRSTKKNGNADIRSEGLYRMKDATYEVTISEGDVLLHKNEGPLSGLLELPELRSLGIDPAAFADIAKQSSPEFTIHRTRIELQGEEMEAYRLTLNQAGGQVGEIYMNQIGQVLMIRTMFGYSAQSGDGLEIDSLP